MTQSGEAQIIISDAPPAACPFDVLNELSDSDDALAMVGTTLACGVCHNKTVIRLTEHGELEIGLPKTCISQSAREARNQTRLG